MAINSFVSMQPLSSLSYLRKACSSSSTGAAGAASGVVAGASATNWRCASGWHFNAGRPAATSHARSSPTSALNSTNSKPPVLDLSYAWSTLAASAVSSSTPSSRNATASSGLSMDPLPSTSYFLKVSSMSFDACSSNVDSDGGAPCPPSVSAIDSSSLQPPLDQGLVGVPTESVRIGVGVGRQVASIWQSLHARELFRAEKP